jgi:hypothetical protein
MISAELLGHFIVSESNLDSGDRFTHFLNFGVQLVDYNVKPGIFIQLPLNKRFSDDMDYVLGLKMGYSIN